MSKIGNCVALSEILAQSPRTAGSGWSTPWTFRKSSAESVLIRVLWSMRSTSSTLIMLYSLGVLALMCSKWPMHYPAQSAYSNVRSLNKFFGGSAMLLTSVLFPKSAQFRIDD